MKITEDFASLNLHNDCHDNSLEAVLLLRMLDMKETSRQKMQNKGISALYFKLNVCSNMFNNCTFKALLCIRIKYILNCRWLKEETSKQLIMPG